MALFDLTRNTKDSDKDVVKKSKSTKKSNSVKVSNGIQGTIDLVNQKLSIYRGRYDAIHSRQELHDYIDRCIEKGYCAIDTETTGLNVWRLQLAGVCLYTPEQKAVYVPINHVSHITGIRYSNQCTEQDLKEELQRASDLNVKWIMHNAHFDIKVFIHTVGIRLKCYWDTLLAANCIKEDESHGLKDLHLKYCPEENEHEAVKYSDLFKGEQFLKVPTDTAKLYAAGDAIKTFELYEYQVEIFKDADMSKVYDVFMNMEMPIVDVVINMEEYGVLIDTDYSAKLSVKYNNLYYKALDNINEALEPYKDKVLHFIDTHKDCKVEWPVNINSPTQLSELLYDVFKVEPVDKRNPTGTGEEILSTLARNNIYPDLCNAILKVREVKKLLSTYIDKLPNSTESDGRIHCSFNQYGAATGRFSSSEPNLQNIPSHNKEIRKMFTAPKGRVFIGADFSQQEPVVTAHLSNDEKMRDAFASGNDIYSTIASVSFNRSYKDCLEHFPEGTPIKKLNGTWVYSDLSDYDKLADGENDTFEEGKEYRGQAKKIVLGILYGRSIPAIAEQLNVDVKQAANIYNTVLDAFPQLRQFMEESQQCARIFGYVETAWGRRRHLPDMQLKPYVFTYKDVKSSTFDPLSFEKQNLDVPIDLQRKYTEQLVNTRNFKDRALIKEKLDESGIKVKDNTKFIEDATRQCVNSRVQGSAADITKKAMIAIDNDKLLQDLDFHLIIQVHDEVIGECPIENAKRASERVSYLMVNAAKEKISIPMKCDPTITQCWYGEELVLK